MTETPPESPSPEPSDPEKSPPRSRLRRWLRRIFLGTLACFLLALSIVLTTGYWLPHLAKWAALKVFDVRVEIGELDLFPLGRTIVRDIRIGETGKDDALTVGEEKVAYADLFSLLRGEIQSVSLDKIDVREAELYSLVEKVQAQAQAETLQTQEGEEAPLWMPDLTRVRNVRLIRTDGQVYALRSVDVRSVGRTGNETLVEIALETGPIDSMLPLDIDSPLSLEARLEIGADAIRLLGFQINLGPLLKLKSDEKPRVLGPERIALGFEKVEVDPEEWGEVLDVPLEGLDFKIRVPRVEFGMAIRAAGESPIASPPPGRMIGLAISPRTIYTPRRSSDWTICNGIISSPIAPWRSRGTTWISRPRPARI